MHKYDRSYKKLEILVGFDKGTLICMTLYLFNENLSKWTK